MASTSRLWNAASRGWLPIARVDRLWPLLNRGAAPRWAWSPNLALLPTVPRPARPPRVTLETEASRSEISDVPAAVKNMPAALRPHQRDAVAATVRCLCGGGGGGGPAASRRARVVLPSGAGKTLVGLWVLEALTPATGVALVVLPRKALIEQTLRSYREHSTRFSTDRNSLLVVASDLSDKNVRCTTDAAEIQKFLAEPCRGPKLLLSTYDSLKRIGEAGASIDAAVFDEAHHMAGRSQVKFTPGLDDAVLSIHRRLFMTATPRVFPRWAGEDVRSMDNSKVFGREAYRMTHSEAVDQGIIVPVKLLIYNVTETYAALCARNPNLRVLLDEYAIPRHDAELALATLDAFERFGLRKAVSFHSTNSEAAGFQGHADRVFEAYRPRVVEVARVYGQMKATEREPVLDWFRISDSSLLANSRLLFEGVDIPNVDLVLLASPRKSHVDILQMSGRAARNSPGKEFGCVLLPARSLNGADLDKGAYTFAVNVMRAFLEQDEQLQQRLQAEAENAGGEGRGPNVARVFEDRVEFVGFDADTFKQNLSTAALLLVDPWDVHFGRLTAYKAAHGDCRVSTTFVTADGFKLGTWVDRQRQKRKGDDGGLSDERTARLEALGFVWDPNDAAWDEGYKGLAAYKAAHGDCHVPRSFATADGHKLGAWVDTQRQKRKGDDGGLSEERTARLEALGFVWDTLEAAWDEGYKGLAAYKAAHGDCLMPQSFATADGHKLGTWVNTQRQKRKGDDGGLSEERTARLEALGFVWDTLEAAWDEGYKGLAAYKAAHGDCLMPQSFVTADGHKLGTWVNTQRQKRKGDDGGLSEERTARLEALGFVWDPNDAAWDEGYKGLAAYKAAHGDCHVPKSFVTADGHKLGAWVNTQRQKRKGDDGGLSEERTARLEALGFVWDTLEAAWDEGYKGLAAYKAAHGDCLMPQSFVTADGFKLGTWVNRQRQKRKGDDGGLSEERTARLEALGFVWDPNDAAWDEGYKGLAAYKAAHDDCHVPRSFVTANGHKLGTWVDTQRQKRKGDDGGLSEERTARLEALGFVWDPNDAAWDEGYKGLAAYKAAHGDCLVPQSFATADGHKLGTWISTQRQKRKGDDGGLSEEQTARLEALGFVWDPNDAAWDEGYKGLAAYKAAHDDCHVPRSFVTANGHKLGTWVDTQRQKRKGDDGGLSEERTARLEALGFVWDPNDAAWDEGYKGLAAYKAAHGDCLVPQSFATADGHKLGTWISTQRQKRKGDDGGLSEEQTARLEALGFVWDPNDAAWDEGYKGLAAYKAAHDDCHVPRSFVTANGHKLGTWVNTQRQRIKGDDGGSNKERAARLEALGFVWVATR